MVDPHLVFFFVSFNLNATHEVTEILWSTKYHDQRKIMLEEEFSDLGFF